MPGTPHNIAPPALFHQFIFPISDFWLCPQWTGICPRGRLLISDLRSLTSNFSPLPPHSLPKLPRLLQRGGGVVGVLVIVGFYEIAVALFEEVEGFPDSYRDGLGGDLVVLFDQGVEGVFFGDGVFFLYDNVAGVQSFFYEVDADACFRLVFVQELKPGEKIKKVEVCWGSLWLLMLKK